MTERELPWLVEELDGVAARRRGRSRWRCSRPIEELDDGPASEPARGCSDLVACAPASADGHVWVAHTNDLSAPTEQDLVAIEWRLPGDPVLFTVGVGPWISVGFNSAGLALTGNELTPNDNRVGIPRLLQVRDILRRRTLDDAVVGGAAPGPRVVVQQRAGAPRRRRRLGGGIGHRRRAAAAGSIAARSPTPTTTSATRMRRYEGDVDYAARSDVRYRRALSMACGPGNITAATLRAALSDHSDAPDSICRHVQPGSQTKTVFWCIADVTRGEITYGRGNPCDSDDQLYAFD